jgi:hypothetical protein
MSLTERSALETFTKKVIQVYHLPTIPASPPQDIMACMALMVRSRLLLLFKTFYRCLGQRKIAKPLLKKDSQRGGDTGFWKDIEAELDVLFDKNGNQRDSPAWRKYVEPCLYFSQLADTARQQVGAGNHSAR